MAAAVTKKQHTPPPATASISGLMDPKFEWAEKAGSYLLRLALPGFRKEDFRVQVDGAGRLTVQGAKPAGMGAAGESSFSKVFQLPATASLDDIVGRFEAGVLTLTMHKNAAGAGAGDREGAAPTSIEEIKRKQPGVANETKPKKEEIAKEDELKKSMEEATSKAQGKNHVEEEGKSRKQEQQKPPPLPMKQEQEVKPKAPHAAADGPTPMKPVPKPEGGEKAKAAVVPESLAERVRRRGEEELSRAAPSAKEAKAEPERKVTAWRSGNWKERVQGELKVLTDMKWADSVVEAARKKKEVVAVGIAAFSLGVLVSRKLFRK